MNAERFWAKVERGEGCWLFTGYRASHGYGSHRYQGKAYRAHRLAYLLTYGTLPSDLNVCHHCDNPGCVRPDHLFLGTQADNMRDMIAKGRGIVGGGGFVPGSGPKNRPVCMRGHAMTGDNVRIRPSGRRVCRECRCHLAREFRKRRSNRT